MAARKKTSAKAGKPKANTATTAAAANTAEDGSLKNCKVRVRMYRHGLGDCFLLSFPRKGNDPFHMLIDFGALNRDGKHMLQFAQEIEQATARSGGQKSRLDLIVATHEHKDHLSGFNQAREVFDRMEIGGVWMGWTEDPEDKEAQRLAGVREEAANHLRAALASPFALGAAKGDGPLANVLQIMRFTDGDDTVEAGKKTIAQALKYLRLRGEKSGNMKYLEPGDGPLQLPEVDGVRIFVLGPPRGKLLLSSAVTKEMQKQDVVYHLRSGFESHLAPNLAALRMGQGSSAASATDQFHPFTREHRIERGAMWWEAVKTYVDKTYDDPKNKWRRIDEDWLGAFDQLALKLADDTNNTSLVLAFEIVKTGEVLLFVGDAQVGNWQSWEKVEFKIDENKLPAHDLLRRTVFYKVGHHASHNATLKKGGLELMTSPKLVAFVPLDKETAANQGRTDPKTKKPRGWEMPAKALFKALKERAADRVVISDVTETLSPAAKAAGVKMEPTYCEFKL